MIQIQALQVDFHQDKLDLGLLVWMTSWREFLSYKLTYYYLILLSITQHNIT